jgi:uncharacterized protein
MAKQFDSEFDREKFNGFVRLFPLPNLVLFPHALQPLHIFEPRYLELMAAALATDGLITMAILAPGWERDYEGRPAIHKIACLGRITTHHTLPDGRYTLLLQGVARVRIVEELPLDNLFRTARAELVDDVYPAQSAVDRPRLERSLLAAVRHLLAKTEDGAEAIEHLLRGEVPLGVLTDLFAYAADLGMPLKTQLLDELNVDVRAQLLLDHLPKSDGGPISGATGPDTFPPKFSLN